MSIDTAFSDTCQFTDDVLGPVLINRVERDCIDTPEYRRLFRLSQLGLVDRVYHTANHTRGIHSIGVCVRAKHLVDRLNANTPRVNVERQRRGLPTREIPPITVAEKCLISLGALLHDLPHGPFSHDIEKKTHRYGNPRIKLRSHSGPYHKHDDFENNPALHVLLFDSSRSVLARVLRSYSPSFWSLLQKESSKSPNVERFVSAAGESTWAREDLTDTILASLLFHVLVFEELEDALRSSRVSVATDFDRPAESWGLGREGDWAALHRAWYQPYRHDIIGNTLSADLLDYLARDSQRLGMRSVPDQKLLQYYVLVHEAVPKAADADTDATLDEITRCAIDLNDYKRGGFRAERINDVFRLLDFRHQIHEKAIHHRVVQSAIAMLGRALLLAGDRKPAASALYAVGEQSHVITGDDHLLALLTSRQARATTSENYHSLAQKLLERRLYRPLVMLPGDEVCRLLRNSHEREYARASDEERLRLLGAILDSRHFAPFFGLVCWCVERLLDHSLETVEEIDQFIRDEVIGGRNLDWARGIVPARVILWTTPYKQLYKDPAIVVRAAEHVDRIDRLAESSDASPTGEPLPPSLLDRLRTGIADSEARYASMWGVCVFISDGLYYSGGLARLLTEHGCRTDDGKHVEHLEQAQDEILLAIEAAWEWWTGRAGRSESSAATALDKEMDSTTFVRLLEMFEKYGARRPYDGLFSKDRRRICGVELGQYVHAEPDTACKDVRYRFDENANLERAIADAGLGPESRTEIEALLRLTKVDLEHVKHEEIADIVRHVGPSIRQVGETVGGQRKAAREGDRPDDGVLRRSWLMAEAGAGFVSAGVEDGASREPSVLRGVGSAQSGGSSGADSRKDTGGVAEFRLSEAAGAARTGRRRVSNRRKTDS